MRTVGAFQAKTHFSALLEKVEKGEHIIITKHGHPIAKLIPTGVIDRTLIKASIQKLQKFSQTNKLGGLNWKKLRDEGRR